MCFGVSDHCSTGSLFVDYRFQPQKVYESEQAAAKVPQTNRSREMNSKSASAQGSSKVCFPSESVRRVSQKGNVNSFVIALLLIVSFLTFVATMLVHYPQKVDAFLNSDQPVQSKHVVTSSQRVP
jgi:hypothetical protein